MQIKLLYFASFQEAAGISSELMEFDGSLLELFAHLKLRYGFKFQAEQIRVAMNGQFVPWQTPLIEAAELAFIPPVSGG